jgi:hypothetical protein
MAKSNEPVKCRTYVQHDIVRKSADTSTEMVQNFEVLWHEVYV